MQRSVQVCVASGLLEARCSTRKPLCSPGSASARRPFSVRRTPVGHLITVKTSIRCLVTSGGRRDSSTTSVNIIPSQKAHRKRQETAASSLRPILDELPSSVDFAVAYGSGVMKQANPSGPAPMIDLIIATPSSHAFHEENLKANPSHYPLHARIGGPSWITRLQESYGAGAWYIPDVQLAGMNVKYGIVSTKALVQDLREWSTFYLAGRLQKPTVTLAKNDDLSSDLNLDAALESNDTAALSLALLLLPDTTADGSLTEYQLWEQIAGLSYAGDPRMAIPGAENPQKVRNIVRGPGALQGFRDKYSAGILKGAGVKVISSTEKGEVDGEVLIQVPSSTESRVKLLDKLPESFKARLVKYLPSTQADSSSHEAWQAFISQPNHRQLLLSELNQISRRPALVQSIKGLITAGLSKSLTYSLAKMRKSSAGRKAQSR